MWLIFIVSWPCMYVQLCLTLYDPMDCSPPDSSVHGNSPSENTGVGCHSLLQGIFLTQGLNLGLLHCGQILYIWATKEPSQKESRKRGGKNREQKRPLENKNIPSLRTGWYASSFIRDSLREKWKNTKWQPVSSHDFPFSNSLYWEYAFLKC